MDVCVIGSGAGGGPVAATLAEAGASVVVLEKGPWYREADFVRDEIVSCRRSFWVPTVADEPRVHVIGAQRPTKSVESWSATCVGGGTAHMSGFVYRLDPGDFALATRYGAVEGAQLADWPFGYDTLAPWYDRVDAVVGVSGLAGAHPFEPPRSGPYPEPPLRESPLAALVDQGAARVGLHPYPTPRMILTAARPGRGPCHYHATCGSYGCETGARGSSLSVWIPAALATDRCELRDRSMAIGITAAGGRVTGVRYVDADGQRHEQEARAVVVSATAIESARLLMLSGLGNASGQLGRNLTFSTLAKGSATFERASLPEAMAGPRTEPFLQRSIRDLYYLGDGSGYDKGGVLNFILPHANPIYAAERLSRRARPRLWGPALMEALAEHHLASREIEVEVFGEFLPNPGTWVGLSRRVRDRWGLQVAEVHLHNHPADQQHSRQLLDRGLAVLEAAGARSVHRERWGGTTWVLQHGTCRFGDDPKTSVLDPDCRVHDLDNLYVVDGSFLPTSGGVPTTLTIMANALRVGHHLAERFAP